MRHHPPPHRCLPLVLAIHAHPKAAPLQDNETANKETMGSYLLVRTLVELCSVHVQRRPPARRCKGGGRGDSI